MHSSHDSGFESRPLSVECEQGSKQSTSAAINIPSPPLSPYLSCGDSDVDEFSDKEDQYLKDDDDDNLVFSSRFQKKRQQQQQYQPQQRTQLPYDQMPTDQLNDMSISSRPSTSAPTTQSSFRIQASRSAPTVGFTFSSNIPAWQSAEERESYALFLAVIEKDYWKNVSTIRSTYFFDGIGRGGGFLAVSVILLWLLFKRVDRNILSHMHVTVRALIRPYHPYPHRNSLTNSFLVYVCYPVAT